MKRALVMILAVVVLAGSLAWLNRVDLVLAFVKYRAHSALDIAPNRPVAWQQGPQTAASGKRPPNIIFILADDLGYNDISTFGGGVAAGAVKTPHIDQLAADGAVFEQSYAGIATCAPSRAMLMTGRYPTRTGFEFTPTPDGFRPVVRFVTEAFDSGLPPDPYVIEPESNPIPYQQLGLPSSEVTIAELLKAQGYYTAHIGKWHLGRGKGFAPNDQGFDDSLLMESGLFLPEDDPNVVNAKLDFDPIDHFLWAGMTYAASFNSAANQDVFEPGGYLTDYWTDEAIKVIRANKSRPFFLYLAHWGVHTPLQATREDYEAVGDIKPHRLRVYAAMVRALDRSVGRINAVLEEEGLADNTIVIFSSDNGGAGYIGLPEVNAPFRGWKITNFEGGLRVPLFIKWPDKIAEGTRLKQPVAHIDVFPTLAAAAGSGLPEGVEIDGVNLLPLATRSGEPWTRETLFWQTGYYRVVRHGDWKLQVSEHPNKAWLYNLAVDPTEQNNLADEAPGKLAELQALLDEHQANARPPLYPFTSHMSIAVDKTLAEQFEEGDEYIHWPQLMFRTLVTVLIVLLLLFAGGFWLLFFSERPPLTTDPATLAGDGSLVNYCELPELDGTGLMAKDIPKGNTPGCRYEHFPLPILAECTEPLPEDADDIRGLWIGVEGKVGHVERVEQCGDRTVVTSSGIIHDYGPNSTAGLNTNDTEGAVLFTLGGREYCPRTSASMIWNNGVLDFHVLGWGPLVVRRYRDGEQLIWEYADGDVTRMNRICQLPAEHKVPKRRGRVYAKSTRSATDG